MSRYDTVKDNTGKVVGSISQHSNYSTVFDANHNQIGSVNQNGTRDQNSNLTLNKPLPGSFFGKK